MLSQYGQQSQLAKTISKELSLSGSAKPSTQLNQIMRLFNKDPQVMKNLITVMGEKDANTFLNDLSGAILSDWIPAGKMGNYIRALGEGGAIGSSVLAGNPAAATAAGASVAASSPRVVGTTAALAGKLGDTGIPSIVRKGTTLLAPKVLNQKTKKGSRVSQQ